MLVQWTAVAN